MAKKTSDSTKLAKLHEKRRGQLWAVADKAYRKLANSKKQNFFNVAEYWNVGNQYAAVLDALEALTNALVKEFGNRAVQVPRKVQAAKK